MPIPNRNLQFNRLKMIYWRIIRRILFNNSKLFPNSLTLVIVFICWFASDFDWIAENTFQRNNQIPSMECLLFLIVQWFSFHQTFDIRVSYLQWTIYPIGIYFQSYLNIHTKRVNHWDFDAINPEQSTTELISDIWTSTERC